ncbi:MAG: saccharopine dehydrogenase NADP-binding domain-containing protein [Gemmatimonadales bacterium]|nr:saccharopine dehydrogenase NADP-binding domain-containing protein [Gemmatimonadales bacterium]
MKYLLLGAGLQGTAIAYDLLNQAEDTTALTILDGNGESLDRITGKLQGEQSPDSRLTTVQADVRDESVLGPLMEKANVVISAVNYWYNASLAALAVEKQAHFLDLGGNNDIVAQEFELNDRAVEKGVSIIPDCGLAPGLAGILGYWLVDGLARAESLKLRVGGLPAEPFPPLNYKLVFSVQGLINEYIEPCAVVRQGRTQAVPGLSELETLRFPEPFGELEAFQTSGGTSTLPRTLAGRVPDLDYKTIRYKGHRDQIKLLHELGLCDSIPMKVGNVEVAPRELLADLLTRKLDLPGPDVVLLRATVVGWTEGDGANESQAVRRAVQIVDHHDQKNDISAMARMTGFPAAIIAGMLARGEVRTAGTHCQELVIPGDRMIQELRHRGVDIIETTTRPEDPE